jgi:hypothetical protein
MALSRFAIITGILALAVGAGCCSWCQQHCPASQPPPPPAGYYAPAPNPCCVPQCPPGTVPAGVKPVPVAGYSYAAPAAGWQQNYAGGCPCQ